MAITRGATVTTFIDSTGHSDLSTFEHTVDSNTSMLVLVLSMESNETVVTAPKWGSTELTLVNGPAGSGSGQDVRNVVYALLSPSSGTDDITFKISATDNRHATAVNYIDTVVSSIANAIKLVDQDINDVATSTGVLSTSSGTSGNTFFLAGVFKGGDANPSDDQSFDILADSATGIGTGTDTTFYVADKINWTSLSTVTINWNRTDENSQQLLEIVPASTATDVTVNPSSVALSLALLSETVTAIKNASIDSGLLALTEAILSPSVIAEQSVSVSVGLISMSEAILSPSVSVEQHVSISVGSISLAENILGPTVTAKKNVSVSLNQLSLTEAIHSPNILTGTNVSVDVNAVALSEAVYSPNVVAEKNVTVSPSAISYTYGLNSASVTTEQNTSVDLGILSLSEAIISPNVITQKNVQVSTSVINLVENIYETSVSVGVSALITPDVISYTEGLLSVSVSTEKSVSVDVSAITYSFNNYSVDVIVSKSLVVEPNAIEMIANLLSPSVELQQDIQVQLNLAQLGIQVNSPKIVVVSDADYLKLTTARDLTQTSFNVSIYLSLKEIRDDIELSHLNKEQKIELTEIIKTDAI